ncbi:hypothetical protein SAMN05443247_01448 [Bradyrhizobium erythrophlei]|nr:hypothetical protein SAMN05443247_01448 [Bradyrhizobium erythrophlei]
MNLEIAKLAASLASPIVTVVGFWFVWQQLKNTNRQIEIAGRGLEASNIQNKTNQDWKRAEFIAGEVKGFYQDPVVVKVLQMIDYNDRRYDIGMLDRNGIYPQRSSHAQRALLCGHGQVPGARLESPSGVDSPEGAGADRRLLTDRV